uniref:Uncharacterized protein n=1 Tax=Candidatus Methanogaster sp. ANME-2c ERB4 TaxID=2759911 RepID=A0A7G9YPX0_9EURY|nr:hypothetical protein LAFMFFPE_00006 [Methanosarcinales archaeon ANME-2c ERB4]
MIYALVITISAPNFVSSDAGIICMFGFTTGMTVGVSILPCLVCNLPILPAESLCVISKWDMMVVRLSLNVLSSPVHGPKTVSGSGIAGYRA